MIKRTIMLIPELTNLEFIESIRSKYDPLYGKVKPHITIVHPFPDELSKDELRQEIVKKIDSIKPFKLKLGKIIVYDNHLFLTIIEGNDKINFIHEQLNKGILKKYYREDIKYIPHLTIGCVKDNATARRIAKKIKLPENINFEANINKLSVEKFGDDGIGHIDITIEF